MGTADKDWIMMYGNSLSFTVLGFDRVLWWKSVVICVSGRKFRGISLVITHSLPPSLLYLPSLRVTRQSACVWQRGATMCSFSRECRQSSQPPLRRRGEEGERRRGTGGKPLSAPPPLLDSPPSLSHYLFQRSPSHHSPSLVSADHTLTQACLHHNSLHITDYIKYI